MQSFQDKVIEIIDAHPANLINAVDPVIMKILINCDDSAERFRRSVFDMWIFIDGLGSDATHQSSVPKIMAHIGFCCTKVLRQKSELFIEGLAAAPSDDKLTENVFATVIKVSPKKFAPAVRTLFKIDNEDSEMALALKLHLKNLIRDMPKLVVQWIDALEFYKFKDEFLAELTVSIILNGLDIKALLFPNFEADREWALKVTEMLDKTLSNSVDRSPVFLDLYQKFSVYDMIKKIAKYAQEGGVNMITHCPNTVKHRRMMNFLYVINQLTTEHKTSNMQVFKNDYGTFGIDNIIQSLQAYEANEPFAGIAFGELFNLSPEDLYKISESYTEKCDIYRFHIDEKKKELNRIIDNSNYMDSKVLDQDDYSIYLVDDSTSLMFAMKKLMGADTFAFDVEARYVCQDVNSKPKAVLIQIAVKDCVIIIDISAVKKNVSEDCIKMFFEVFFDIDLKRVGFDLKSDLTFLQKAFSWMPEYLRNEQPEFYCIPSFVQVAYKYREWHSDFPVLERPSLDNIVVKWLKKTLSVKEPIGDWDARPLTDRQLQDAALDARHTLEAFQYIEAKLENRGLQIYHVKFDLTLEEIDNKAPLKVVARKEKIKDVMDVLGGKIKQMKRQFHDLESSEIVTIVVDFPFLPLVPILRRLGYHTYDQRDEDGGSQFKRGQVIETLSNYMKNTLNGVEIRKCYLLTDMKSAQEFELGVSPVVITASPFEPVSKLISLIMDHTDTIVDVATALNRCFKCSKIDTCVKVPANVYRIIYIHFARVHGFFHKLIITQESKDEFFRKIYEEIRNKKMVKIQNRCLYLQFDDIKIGFSLEDEIKYVVSVKDEKLKEGKYKCNVRIFENFDEKNDDVSFCYNCSVFF